MRERGGSGGWVDLGKERSSLSSSGYSIVHTRSKYFSHRLEIFFTKYFLQADCDALLCVLPQVLRDLVLHCQGCCSHHSRELQQLCGSHQDFCGSKLQVCYIIKQFKILNILICRGDTNQSTGNVSVQRKVPPRSAVKKTPKNKQASARKARTEPRHGG